ncbi:MAG: DUF4097 family beta strand repeat-containing protein [Acidobacteriota bacterium]
MRPQSLLAIGSLLVIASAGRAETTKTLRVTLEGGTGRPFAVENLAGTMTVIGGEGGVVTAVAVIHAEDDTLAEAVRFEQVAGKDGVPTLRVVYPLDRESTFRYPAASGSSTVEYADRKVRVSRGSGALLWAEVEVHVPGQVGDATFRNLVGTLHAAGIAGRLLLDSASGDIDARELGGTVRADTGSGDVRAESVKGVFTCDTGSGDCTVTGFDGSDLVCDTGSGDVRLSKATSGKVTADTGSGSVRIDGADIEELDADTGSGSVAAEVVGTRLRRVKADTGSGSFTLRLPPETSFELATDMGGGDLKCEFADARAIVRHREVVGYSRGEGKVRIDADTGSGDVTIGPTR